MSAYPCPKGHPSTDPDYCSECGARIGASTVVGLATTSAVPAPSAEVCPDCSTPRTPGARYCEVCRYDFEQGSPSGQAAPSVAAVVGQADPVAPAVVEQAPVASLAGGAFASGSPGVDVTPPSGEALPTTAPRLNIVVTVDPSLAEDDDMRKQCPTDTPDLVFPLDLDENLVGRRSDDRKIFPEISVNDPGVSHRQLKILRQPDGSFAVLELGSANGTSLNGVALKAGLLTPLAAGDELTLGMWTRLKVRRR